MLHSQSGKQGLFTKKSKTLSYFAKEAFNYIRTSCSDIVPRQNFVVRKSYPITGSGMTRMRVKGPPKEAVLLRFETKEQLVELVTKVFGITGRFGLRTRSPKLSEKEGIFILENCAINYIHVCSTMTVPLRMHTNNDGVDLIYTKDCFLKIVVRYRHYLLHYNSNGAPLNCPCDDLLDMLMHFPRDQPVFPNLSYSSKDDEDDSDSCDNKNEENDNPTNKDNVSLVSVSLDQSDKSPITQNLNLQSIPCHLCLTKEVASTYQTITPSGKSWTSPQLALLQRLLTQAAT